jgi:hypothetical protein
MTSLRIIGSLNTPSHQSAARASAFASPSTVPPTRRIYHRHLPRKSVDATICDGLFLFVAVTLSSLGAPTNFATHVSSSLTTV